MMNKTTVWYNYVTGEYDYLDAPPATDSEAEQYVRQGAGVNLYRLYREHDGLSILEAMGEVLSAAATGKAAD